MISIGIAAAQVGVSTSTLRKWESRHGLPEPRRGSGGARWYTTAEVARLHAIKRRLDLGQSLPQALQEVLQEVLQELQEEALAEPATGVPTVPFSPAVPDAANRAATCADTDPAWASSVLGLLRTQGSAACHRWLHTQRQQLGALGFVEGVAAPLMAAVGAGWADGHVAVHEEHALAALVQAVLALPPTPGAVSTPPPLRPWLLATPSGEWHTLGLSMLHAVLHEAGQPCINLGASVPHAELAAAARLHGAQGVALSLSAGTAPRVAQRQLKALRAALPADVALWVGGAGVGLLARLPAGVHAPGSCRAACQALLQPAPHSQPPGPPRPHVPNR
jgi:DNA-binding transcriptional MerR regulator